MTPTYVNIKIITNQYTKIYNFFFKYIIYIIISIVWLFTVTTIIKTNVIFNPDNNFSIEKLKIIWELEKKINQNINNKNITVYINDWILDNNPESLLSINNLLIYKWFVLPQNVFIYQINPIKDKAYFDTSDYELKDLENIAKNTIFTNIDKTDKITKNNTLLPLNENIEKTFYTKCIYQKKEFNKSCNYYIKNFINSFFVYNIEKDYNWLINVFNILKKTNYKDNMCIGMKKYITYSKKLDIEMEQIFEECWPDYLNTFNDIKNFLEIQDQLKKWYISSSIYTNKNLNTYKLLSYQQIIYNDLNQNTINVLRFDSYLNYLKNILKNYDIIETIDHIYIDLSYLFNNNYVLTTLNKNKYKLSENKKTEIENIIKWINTINNWNSLEWYKWLNLLLLNKKLKEHKQVGELISENDWSKIWILLNSFKSLSFLRILNEKASEDKIKISWYLLIKLKQWEIPLYLWFIADKNWDIESININEYEDLNKTVSIITKQKKYSITELYQYIQSNIEMFLSNDNLSTCDIILSKLKDYQEDNKEINSIDMVDCNENKIYITQEKTQNAKITNLSYQIKLENFNIQDISISDKDVEYNIKEYIKNINTNNITIPHIIYEIVSYNKQEHDYKQEWNNKTIIAIEDFNKYLSITPNTISELDWKINVEFILKDINFIWTYNIKNKILNNLYFKYKLWKDELAWNDAKYEQMLIKNFEIELKEENQNKINNFILNPLNYLRSSDQETVDKYKSIRNIK